MDFRLGVQEFDNLISPCYNCEFPQWIGIDHCNQCERWYPHNRLKK